MNYTDELKRKKLQKKWRKKFLNSDLVNVMNLLSKSGQDYEKKTNYAEADFEGDIEITLTRKDIIFTFNNHYELIGIGNFRPRPKPEPLAGTCALKVA